MPVKLMRRKWGILLPILIGCVLLLVACGQQRQPTFPSGPLLRVSVPGTAVLKTRSRVSSSLHLTKLTNCRACLGKMSSNYTNSIIRLLFAQVDPIKSLWQ